MPQCPLYLGTKVETSLRMGYDDSKSKSLVRIGNQQPAWSE